MRPSVVASISRSPPEDPTPASCAPAGQGGITPLLHSEARDETIFRFTRQMMRERRLSWDVFGQQVAECYLRAVPVDAREIDFSEASDVAARMRANGQIVKRWFDRNTTTRFPVQAEEAWVEALVEPYRSECRRELVRRYGFLAAPIPSNQLTVAEGLQCMSSLSDEFGATLHEIAAIVADGRIDPADRDHAKRGRERLDALIGVATSLREQLVNV